ncbi:MAG: DUF4055 domain-containing protein [Dehalococcoidia bacterium]
MTKAELLTKHTHYAAFVDEWRFFVRSYFGGMRYREGDYLLQHPFESDENYRRRKKVAYFYNNCQPIVDIFVSLLFQKEPERDFGSFNKDPLFDQFRADADLEGNTYSQFIREAQRFASIYGRVSIIVDKPAMQAATRAEAETLGIRPYLTMITPENVLNWRYVRLPNGRTVLDRVTIVEGRDEKGDPSSIRVWDRNFWILYEIDPMVKPRVKAEEELIPVNAGMHGLGRVPLVNIYNKNSATRMMGLSDIEDIAGINKNIYYLCSDAQEIVENTAFPMLAAPYESGAEDNKVTGPKNIYQFDASEPNAKPFWLEPPHSSLNEIREYINQHRRTIFQMANLLGIYISGESKQPPAGIALEIENQQRNAVLAEKAANSEQAENRILELYAMWEGRAFDGEVKYSTDFSIRDLDMNSEKIINVLQRDIDLADEFWRALQNKLARNLLGDLTKAKRKVVHDAIDRSRQTKNVPNAAGE